MVEIGKQTGEPPSQHCFAGTRGADEEQMMTPSSRDLERQPCHRLTADLGEIIDDDRRLAPVNGTHPTRDRRPPRAATSADDSPRSPDSRSPTSGRLTRTRKSKRSSSGPDNRDR